MATFIEQTSFEKIAKALIINHDILWVLVCDNKQGIKYNILEKVRALGIEPESQLYRDIDYSICDTESIKDRSIHWNDYVVISDIDGLLRETIGISCNKICVNMIGF